MRGEFGTRKGAKETRKSLEHKIHEITRKARKKLPTTPPSSASNRNHPTPPLSSPLTIPHITLSRLSRPFVAFAIQTLAHIPATTRTSSSVSPYRAYTSASICAHPRQGAALRRAGQGDRASLGGLWHGCSNFTRSKSKEIGGLTC